MTFHPQTEAFLQWMANEHLPPVPTLSPAEARIRHKKVIALLTKKLEPIAEVKDKHVPGPGGDIPIRIYAPDTRTVPEFLLYFHGGGWVLGSIDEADNSCRMLANKTGRIVVSVDYRLAPEYKFPAAPEDCYAVAKWLAENGQILGGNAEALAVCGDSSGGNLAAAVSQMAKDRGTPSITDQILVYPITDLSDQNYKDFPDNLSPNLTKGDMVWFIKHYIAQKEDLRNQCASPILRESCKGLPTTLIVTAEYDILTRQCSAYADKLKKAGVQVDCIHYTGLVHGFLTLPDVFDAAHDAAKRIAEKLLKH